MATLSAQEHAKIRRFIKADARAKAIPIPRGHGTTAWETVMQGLEDLIEGTTSFGAGETFSGRAISLMNTNTPGLSVDQKRCVVLGFFVTKHERG